MRQQLTAGGYLDFLTKDELKESLGHSFDHAIRDLYRGIDYLQYVGQGNGTGLLTLPYAPESGYSWSIKLLSAQLSAAGVLSVYPSSSPNVAPIAVITAVTNGPNIEAVATFSSNSAVVKDSAGITFFSASNILTYRIMVEQVPTEMQGKL
jgi:hypothetical protein